MRFITPPLLFRLIYPGLTWHRTRNEKTIYLTFDDGPVPDVTPEVLKILDKRNIKATFFCVGENIIKHPAIFHDIKVKGHQVGNHTFNHLQGWKTPTDQYLKNIEKCQVLTKSNLFRPPYGKTTLTQQKQIKKNFEIIMWDVITYDFDQSLTTNECFKLTLKHTRNGSIVVFHDNIKAKKKMTHVLPRLLDIWLEQGYQFKTL